MSLPRSTLERASSQCDIQWVREQQEITRSCLQWLKQQRGIRNILPSMIAQEDHVAQPEDPLSALLRYRGNFDVSRNASETVDHALCDAILFLFELITKREPVTDRTYDLIRILLVLQLRDASAKMAESGMLPVPEAASPQTPRTSGKPKRNS